MILSDQFGNKKNAQDFHLERFFINAFYFTESITSWMTGLQAPQPVPA